MPFPSEEGVCKIEIILIPVKYYGSYFPVEGKSDEAVFSVTVAACMENSIGNEQ